MKANPGRLVALRIHEVHAAGTPATTSGAIRNRNISDPRMEQTWRAAHELGLAIQLHMIPHYAPKVGELAAKFRGLRVVIDHLARPGQGTAAEYEDVLRLAKIDGVHMKFSTTGVAAVVQRALSSFGRQAAGEAHRTRRSVRTASFGRNSGMRYGRL